MTRSLKGPASYSCLVKRMDWRRRPCTLALSQYRSTKAHDPRFSHQNHPTPQIFQNSPRHHMSPKRRRVTFLTERLGPKLCPSILYYLGENCGLAPGELVAMHLFVYKLVWQLHVPSLQLQRFAGLQKYDFFFGTNLWLAP